MNLVCYKKITTMRTRAVIERGDDGVFSIYAPDIQTGVIGTGSSVKEAKADFDNSVMELIESAKEDGFPCELVGLEFEYKWDIASIFNYFDWIKLSKLSEASGIDASLLRHYKRGQYISETQAKKVVNVLHRHGEELMQLAV
jgi:predicted RNase H-like HicB family nuclease